MPIQRRTVLTRVLLALALALPTWAAPEPSPASATTGDEVAWPFMYRVGQGLYLEGKPFQMSGFNLYYANNRLDDGCTNLNLGEGDALDATLDDMGGGKNVLRSWFFQHLAQTDVAGDGGLRDWAAFDHTLQVADLHGMKVIATLTDQWGECGSGAINGTKDRTWYESGYEQVDPGNLVSYRDWVREIVIRYRDDPRIAMWQLVNEGEVRDTPAGGCADEAANFAVFHDWATDVSALVKSLDPNHLVSLGTLGSGQCGTSNDYYRQLHALPTIDLCEVHDYGSALPIYGDQWNGLQVRIDQCAALDKPLFVGEVGINPSQVGGTLIDRAVVLDEKIRVQRDRGIVGHLAWAWTVNASDSAGFDIGADDPVLEVLTNTPPATVERLNVASDGTPEEPPTDLVESRRTVEISGDGRIAAFSAVTTTLVPGVDASQGQVFIRDRATRTTELLVTGLGGGPVDGHIPSVTLSGSGRFAAFRTSATNLAEDDLNGRDDLYVTDRLRDSVARVSVMTDGSEIPGESLGLGFDMSSDGRYIVFDWFVQAAEPPLDAVVYLHDRDADGNGVFDESGGASTVRIDRAADGTDADDTSFLPSISPNGRYIAFTSVATNLTATPDALLCSTPDEPIEGSIPGPTIPRSCLDIFVRDRDTDGDGVLDEADAVSVSIASLTNDGSQPDGDSLWPQVANTGAVAFLSSAPSLGAPGPGEFDLFLRNPTLESTVPAGPGAGTTTFSFETPTFDLSADGTRILYASVEPNVPTDTNNVADVFLFESGLTTRLSETPDGSQLADSSFVGALDDDGRFAVLSSLADLATGVTGAESAAFALDLGTAPPPPGLTDIGANMTVTPLHAPTGETPVTVTFASVTGAGVTTISAVDDLAGAPDGFSFGDPPLAWDVSTTATFSGLVTLCFPYEEGQVLEPDGRLMHFSAGAWQEITSLLDAEANVICGTASSLSDFAVVAPGPLAIFIETDDLDSYDHGMLWLSEVIDPTSVPQPDDFTLTIGGAPEEILDVEFVYQGLVGSPPLVDIIGFTRGSAALELKWATDAPPGAAILLGYTPGAHPIRTPDGRELAAFIDADLVFFESGEGLSLLVVDEGAGPDQLIIFLAWQIGPGLPDPANFTVSATSWESAQSPDLVRRRAEHLGATFLYLELPDPVQPDDLVTLTYTAGVNPLLYANGTPLVLTNAEVHVSLATTSTRATPNGEGVSVTPMDSSSGGSFATLTFELVTGGGTTTLTTSETAPPLPAGFSVGDPPTFYNIETTATFEGGIEVCIRYGAADYEDPGAIQLFHFENNAWTDVIPATHDPDTQTICGRVTSLSPFAVVERVYNVTGFFAPVDPPTVVNIAKAGKAIPMKFRLGGDFGLDIFEDGTPLSRRVSCPSDASTDSIEQVAAGGSGLTYDAASNLYTFNWKTDRAWAGTCREFVATFEDGTTLTAIFQFKR